MTGFFIFIGVFTVVFIITLALDSIGFNADNPSDPREEVDKYRWGRW